MAPSGARLPQRVLWGDLSVGPCAPVAGVVPVTGALACAYWNGTSCCPGIATTFLVNAATSGVVYSSEDSVCAGPA